jgi:hypothetical protein
LIKPTDVMAKQPEDCARHVMEAFQELMPLPLHRQTATREAFEQLADPT